MRRPRRNQKKRPPQTSILQWVKQHKLRTFLLVVLLYVGFEFFTLPFWSIAKLKNENPPMTALMQQRIQEAEAKGKTLKVFHQWIPFSRIPKYVLDAIIVSEDGTFYSHAGVDWYEVQESMGRNLEEGKIVRGASTITQQLAKNLYLSTSRTPSRKLKELMITLMLESKLSKRRILELYVNNIEWGPGVFGVQAAARTYFGKSTPRLTRDEAARLAAVIPSPLRYRPNENSKYVMRKKQIVLRRMEARRK